MHFFADGLQTAITSTDALTLFLRGRVYRDRCSIILALAE